MAERDPTDPPSGAFAASIAAGLDALADPKVRAAITAALVGHVPAAPAPPAEPDPGPPIGELRLKYERKHARKLKSYGSIQSAWKVVRRCPLPCGRNLGDACVNDIPRDFGELYEEWRSAQTTRRFDPNSPAGLKGHPAPQTINNELRTTNAFLNWCVEDGLIAQNPIGKLTLADPQNIRESKIGTEEEFEQLLRACRRIHHTLPALVLLYFDAGLRRLEGMRAKWEDLQVLPDGRGVLHLPGRRTKNKKARNPRLTRRTVIEILALPRVSEWIFANSREVIGKKRNKFFGKPYDPFYLYKLFRKAVTLAGLRGVNGERIVLHTLRHSFAYRARRKWKWRDSVIMAQGGWRSRSAFDRYGIVDEDELDEAMDQAENRIAEEQRENRLRLIAGDRIGPRPAEQLSLPPPALSVVRRDEP